MKQKTKTNTIFVCQQCGHSSSKWLGRCPMCSQWNTFVEEPVDKFEVQPAGSRLTRFSSPIVKLQEISIENVKKITTNIAEFDRIMGQGIMPSSITLLGGPPGIGKSTLMLQVAHKLASINTSLNVLYVSGEESLEQIKNRADRLNLSKGLSNIYILAETNLKVILDYLDKLPANVLIIDSIQTMYKQDLTGAPGSVGQIRECAAELMNTAKSKNITVFVLGHVTKEGDIAGPRILEHIVDTVLYFEAEQQHTYRILRSYKNRFGPTSEIGVFEMKSNGLEEVLNPSLMFLSERPKDTSGSTVTANVEGTRPILLEVQSLVTRTAFGLPRRMATGIDYNRVILLVSILENRVGIGVDTHDVYVNIAGGVWIKEPSADLAICCAIFSAMFNKAIPLDMVFVGEIGLSGEVRGVSFIQERITESEKLGFKKIFVPKSNFAKLNKSNGKIEIIPVEKLSQVIEYIRK